MEKRILSIPVSVRYKAMRCDDDDALCVGGGVIIEVIKFSLLVSLENGTFREGVLPWRFN